MVNRPAGGDRSKRWPKEPYDWYVEPPWAIEMLLDRFDFGDDLIFDPCCGRGTTLDVAKARGYATFGQDVIDRYPRHKFRRGNFLQSTTLPRLGTRETSIICNPPYSYREDIAENIIRKALSFNVRQACFLLPIAFLCSNGRWEFFEREFNPSHTAILSDRISCPPGSIVDDYTTFTGGMADYIWLIYTNGTRHRWKTQTVWLRKRD